MNTKAGEKTEDSKDGIKPTKQSTKAVEAESPQLGKKEKAGEKKADGKPTKKESPSKDAKQSKSQKKEKDTPDDLESIK